MGVKISNFTYSDLTGSDKIPFVKDGDLVNNYIGTVSSLSASLIPVNSLTASYVTASNVFGTVTSSSYALSGSYALSASYALSSSQALSSSYALSGSYALTASYSMNGITINNNLDNRILTATVNSSTLNAESNLVFDGAQLLNNNSSGTAKFAYYSASNGAGTVITTGVGFYGTSSYAVNAITSSYLNSNGIATARTYRISGSKIGTPEMYGAIGDGITDDQIAFKHALISHSIVKLDAKTYAIRGYLGMPSYRTLVGEGKDKTIIKLMNNSPYGYDISGQLFIIQNSMQNDTIPVGSNGWTGSFNWTDGGNVNNISGNIRSTGDGANCDTTVVDMAVDSPNYGGGNLSSFTENRNNVTIQNLTIDCNFDNQARHSSFNVSNNPYSASNGGSSYYIPRYYFKVRPTIHAIYLIGENNRVENVRVKNFGYGVAYSVNSNFYGSVYNEEFPILLIGGQGSSEVNNTGSLNNNDQEASGVGNSPKKGNYVIDSEVIDIGSVDLLNPHSNASSIYCHNQSIDLSNGNSNFSTDGGIYNCLVDPGERLFPLTASTWLGSYLDGYESASLKQTDGSLGDWLVGNGSNTGSNGDYAYSLGTSFGGGFSVFKKISGSWMPYTGPYVNKNSHYVNGISGYRAVNNTVKNSMIAFYLDSWRNNVFLENNQFIEVDSGFRFVVSDIPLTSSYNNCVVRNNYVKLLSHDRYFVGGHSVIFYASDRATGTGSTLRNIKNLQIENNTFEIPISQSRESYYPRNAQIVNPRYVGVWFGSETSDQTLYKRKNRSVIIRNNHFLNWKAYTGGDTPIVPGNELYDHNIPFYFLINSGSSYEFDGNDSSLGSFPNTLKKFKQTALPNYIIEGNTYANPIYPSTASLVPMTLAVTSGSLTAYYGVNQVNRFDNIDVGNTISIGVSQTTERLVVRGNISSSGLIVPNSQSYADSISNSFQTLRTGSMVLTGSKLYIYTGLGSAAPFGAGWQTASLG